MYKSLIRPFVQDAKKFILDTFFPIICLGCGSEGNFLCEHCTPKHKPVAFQKCIICRKPSPLGFTHPGCKTPHAPEGMVSFFDYHDAKISSAIIKGKYSFLPGLFREFGALVAQKILQREYNNIFGLSTGANHPSSLSPHAFSLVPIPLAPSRKRWRGFNQAEVLCRSLSEHTNLPVVNILQRTKSTKTQKDLKRTERIKNVSNAFAVNSKIQNLKSQIHNQNFVLVDDVTTTGSTLLEAAKVLKRNGAGKVWCLTVAQD